MQWWEKIFDFYVKASIHVALAVSTLMFISAHFLNISVSQTLYFYVFFSTIPTYNAIKYTSRGPKWYLGLLSMPQKTVYLSFLSTGMALYFWTGLNRYTSAGIFGLALLTAFYALPVLPSGKNLRHLGIFKILIIGVVWAGVAVLLPVLEAEYPFSRDVWLEFVQRLLMIFVLMVPFEIRDLSSDPMDMMTIPQRLGVRKTKWIGLLLCVICFLLNFLEDEVSPFELLAEGGMIFSLSVLLLSLPGKQGRYFASFWVEAFPIFWAACLWAGIELCQRLF